VLFSGLSRERANKTQFLKYARRLIAVVNSRHLLIISQDNQETTIVVTISAEATSSLTLQAIQTKIHHLPTRVKPFMLGQDLAELYEVEPKHITQAVKRNPRRFPSDFYFQLTDNEVDILRSQNITAISNMVRINPLGFHREGANMLSAVLKSVIAAERSVQIMYAFSALEAELLPESDHKSFSQVNSLVPCGKELTLKSEIELIKLQVLLVRTMDACQNALLQSMLFENLKQICSYLGRPLPKWSNVGRQPLADF